MVLSISEALFVYGMSMMMLGALFYAEALGMSSGNHPRWNDGVPDSRMAVQFGAAVIFGVGSVVCALLTKDADAAKGSLEYRMNMTGIHIALLWLMCATCFWGWPVVTMLPFMDKKAYAVAFFSVKMLISVGLLAFLVSKRPRKPSSPSPAGDTVESKKNR